MYTCIYLHYRNSSENVDNTVLTVDTVCGGGCNLSLSVLSMVLFLSHMMLASGIPFMAQWRRATPPSSTAMDSGWV